MLAIVFPAGLKPIYRAWMTFGDVAGWLNTRVILLLLFYVVVLPVGLIMKIFGSDPLHRKADPSMESYRITATAVDKKHMERPY